MNMNANNPTILLNGQVQEQYVSAWRRPISLTHLLVGALLVHPYAHTLSTIL